MSDKTAPILTEDQRDQILEAVREISKSSLKDPDNPPRPGALIGDFKGKLEDFYHMDALLDIKRVLWEQYLLHAVTDGAKGSRVRTPTKRRAAAKQLKQALKAQPTTAVLKSAYPSLGRLDDEVCRLLDDDLKNLAS